ncbi:hypothetical protein PICMEDRAFT_11979 [Pichia membranifaciens NRRL Y-2026]|uniref:Alpha-1,3/1,6-mannosyltransferase ALG2 n=1 Tax=Pichia membranifaciens NRRL Y-2026 TaxID=763406 RepID=A0A1E3NHB2_9ASCO|nr:hypothetical protein PICMEDRAFT_11979 [Pichia membranifaciens NRRL Y-2026]ODQ45517.1 hypothetical protein PICMEDRAFT_11979 [Pichia membranifaciens NRRL Y-2026]
MTVVDTKQQQARKPNIAFIHPDLGIGGAERLIVDAAMALQSVGNSVTIYTSHCDKTHCFEEVKTGLLDVHVYGDFLPTNFKGRFNIVFAFLRQLYLSVQLILSLKIFKYDVLILDQLSYCIPLLHLFSWNTRILFYCHFPDKLLAPHTSVLRQVYRFLFDAVEEISTSYADQIVVNSEFTKSVVRQTFKLLAGQPLEVVYPCVSTDETTFAPSSESLEIVDKLLGNNKYFLSINRFEKKKNIQLAIQSFASYTSATNDSFQSVVISGGYDPRVSENVEYLNELKKICDKLSLSYKVYSPSSVNFSGQLNENEVPNVIFLTSISTDLKNALISKCDILLYTPTNEHFGIVPLEAMRMGKPVLADRSGGPLETIVDYSDDKVNYTGYTISSDVSGWTKALEQVKRLPKEDLKQLSARTKKRVDEKFSLVALRNKLVKVIHQMMLKDSPHSWVTHVVFPILFVVGVTFLYRSYF